VVSVFAVMNCRPVGLRSAGVRGGRVVLVAFRVREGTVLMPARTKEYHQ
jgi:hypothetical protein